jgi:hypothetical protein
MADGFLGNRGLTPGPSRLEGLESALLDLMSVAGLAGTSSAASRVRSSVSRIGIGNPGRSRAPDVGSRLSLPEGPMTRTFCSRAICGDVSGRPGRARPVHPKDHVDRRSSRWPKGQAG